MKRRLLVHVHSAKLLLLVIVGEKCVCMHAEFSDLESINWLQALSNFVVIFFFLKAFCAKKYLLYIDFFFNNFLIFM